MNISKLTRYQQTEIFLLSYNVHNIIHVVFLKNNHMNNIIISPVRKYWCKLYNSLKRLR